MKLALPGCLLALLLLPVEGRSDSSHGLKVSLALTPTKLSGESPQDLTLAISLRNQGTRSLTLYPGAATLSAIVSRTRCGLEWGLTLEPASPGPRAILKELRSYYGPPGEPFGDRYLNQHKLVLAPGQEFRKTMTACWIPRRRLSPGDFDLKKLDPRGLDQLKALGPQLSGSQVVMLNTACAPLVERMRSRTGSLRPGVVFFVPASGNYRWRAGYSQRKNTFFRGETISAWSDPVEVVVP